MDRQRPRKKRQLPVAPKPWQGRAHQNHRFGLERHPAEWWLQRLWCSYCKDCKEAANASCMAHIRRKFVEALEARETCTAPVIELITKLYQLEEQLRQARAGPDQRLTLRREKAAPFLQQPRRERRMPHQSRSEKPSHLRLEARRRTRCRGLHPDCQLQTPRLGAENLPDHHHASLGRERTNHRLPTHHGSSSRETGGIIRSLRHRRDCVSFGYVHRASKAKKEPGPSVSWSRANTWRRPTLTGPIVPLPSALRRFTSGFGMGPGGSNALWSPEVNSSLY